MYGNGLNRKDANLVIVTLKVDREYIRIITSLATKSMLSLNCKAHSSSMELTMSLGGVICIQ